MKTLIILLTVAVLLTACGTKDEKPTADDAKKESNSLVDKVDEAAADAKEEADKAAADAKEEADDALKKIGG